MRRLLFVLPLAIFLIAAAVFLWGLDPERNPGELPSVLVDRPAPEFTLPAVAGGAQPGFSTADLKTGEVTLVNVWASWCVPCRAENPILMRLSEEGVRLLGINYKDKAADALGFLNDFGNPFQRIGADEDGLVAIDWGLTGVPETFVVDGRGVIRYRHIGVITPADLDKKLRPIMEQVK